MHENQSAHIQEDCNRRGPIATGHIDAQACRLWVVCRHAQPKTACLLHPWKRTLEPAPSPSA